MRKFWCRLGGLATAASTLLAGAAGMTGPAAAGALGPYYLAVGASESLGVQPSASRPHGTPTDHGYANQVTAAEQRRWPGLQLIQVGCPGITAEGAVSGRGPCHYAAGSQLATAAAFLRAHRGRTVLATVDLGFNDVRPCLVDRTVAPACVRAALERVDRAVPAIIEALRAAGGPRLEIVGLEHSDPYLGDYLLGARGRRFAQDSMAVFHRLNALLASAYRRTDVGVADVPARYGTSGSGATSLVGGRPLPLGVARACSLTWMCRRHNIHPTVAGYRAIADAIVAAIGR